MNKDESLKFAAKSLLEIDTKKVDSVEVETGTYSDGTTYLDVSVDFLKGGENE